MNKPIFNSLGSNYTWDFARLALKSWLTAKTSSLDKLEQALLSNWPGKQIILTAKGRDAIELGLRGLGIGVGDFVMTQAFSCVAVEEAIIRAGARPIYYDLAQASLAPSINSLEAARQAWLKQNVHLSSIKSIILQFSLGTPAEIKEIALWCRKHQIKLIIDLAQSVGGVDEQERLLGLTADVIVFSFGRDKILDSVSGGAVIFQKTTNANLHSKVTSVAGSLEVLKNASYPFLTNVIRSSFGFGVGKVLLKLLNATGWFYSPVIASHSEPYALHPLYAELVLHRLTTWQMELKHRRQVAAIYHAKLASFSPLKDMDIVNGANQRYAVLVDDPAQFVAYMKKHQIYISDRWYRAPVDSGSLARPTLYQPGSCPNAEKLSQQIVNLPTHINVNLQDAKRIAKLTALFLSIN